MDTGRSDAMIAVFELSRDVQCGSIRSIRGVWFTLFFLPVSNEPLPPIRHLLLLIHSALASSGVHISTVKSNYGVVVGIAVSKKVVQAPAALRYLPFCPTPRHCKDWQAGEERGIPLSHETATTWKISRVRGIQDADVEKIFRMNNHLGRIDHFDNVIALQSVAVDRIEN